LDFAEVKRGARMLAEMLVERCPDLCTLEMRKNKRGDKVFIDYLRNDHAMTAVAPFSLRALPNAPVATPIDWAELRERRIEPQDYTVRNIYSRLARKEDPWTDFERSRRSWPAELQIH